MDSPQEGRAGGREPQSPPGEPSRAPQATPGRPPRGRERQTLLPGLDPGWTVFGPAEEPDDAAAADEPEQPQAPGGGEESRQPELQQPEAVQEPEEPQRDSPAPSTNGAEASAAAPPEPLAEPGTEELPATTGARIEVESQVSPAFQEIEPPTTPEREAEAAPAGAAEPRPEGVPRTSPSGMAPATIEPAQDPQPGPASDEIPGQRHGLPLPWAVVLAASLLTAMGGVIAAHLSGSSGQSTSSGSGTSGAATTAVAPARVEELEREIEALRTQLAQADQEAGQADGLRDELESTRDAVARRLAALEQDLGNVRSRLVERDAQLESERLARLRAEEALDAQGAQASVQAASPAELSAPIEATAPRGDLAPQAPGQEQALRQAAGFDRILAEIESGQAARARARLDGMVEDGVLASDDADGRALLGGLVAGWEALEQAGIAGTNGRSGLDAQALRLARQGLDLAREHRPGFPQEAAGWLGYGEPERSPLHRLERLDRTVEGLEQRLASALAELELEHARDWDWMLELGLPQDPAHAGRHVARFACEHDEELTDLCAQAVLAACVREGDIDPEALARAQHIESWGRRALARPPQERSSADVDLLWLWNARRWYVEAAGYDVLDWDGLAMPEVLELKENWRAELRLQTRLSEPGSGWPPAAGRRSVYLVRAATPARWRIDERAAEQAQGGAVHLSRRHLDADGAALGGSVEVELETAGRSYRYAGSGGVLVDLAAWGVTAAVSPCPELALEELPATSGATLAQAADLRGRLEGAIALVYRDGDWTRWFVPGVGLVREERADPEGSVVIQLVAQAPLR